ncbi:hypothetical protein B4R02_14280 [Salmonella enterica]|nr:hypothetical protein [Salmonella enterica subsp. diarizonae serovar 42:l,v:1,5,7]ECO0851115.1 hypothetical protein [Salmonella enterica subsp. enterica serovar Newport]
MDYGFIKIPFALFSAISIVHAQKCWRNFLSGCAAGRRTAGKPPALRNPRVRLDSLVFLSSIMFATLVHSSQRFSNAQKMLSILDISALSEKVSRKYFW